MLASLEDRDGENVAYVDHDIVIRDGKAELDCKRPETTE